LARQQSGSCLPNRRFPPSSADALDALAANLPMTAEQSDTLRRLAKAAYELDAFKPNLTRVEADLRIAALTAKLVPSYPKRGIILRAVTCRSSRSLAAKLRSVSSHLI
jgi:hypothetical protein